MTEATKAAATDTPSKDLILQKWLRRLEDPNRVQITGQLRTVDEAGNCEGMCAMGELADVFVAVGIGKWSGTTYVSPGFADDGTISIEVISEALGVSEDEASDIHDEITSKNDSGAGFAEIAQLVRREFNLPDS